MTALRSGLPCLLRPESRLWFLHQLQPDLTAYHMPALWRLQGASTSKHSSWPWPDLLERHATLRTSFRLQGSEVLQIIHPAWSLPLARENLWLSGIPTR